MGREPALCIAVVSAWRTQRRSRPRSRFAKRETGGYRRVEDRGKEEMTIVKQSRYNIVVPLLEGRALAHNTLSGATALLPPEEVSILERPSNSNSADPDSHFKNLLYAGFLVPNH
ncbi:MAG: hypothetical protein ACRD33_11605, partial [Candidatus Acidiferrales bacterium]